MASAQQERLAKIRVEDIRKAAIEHRGSSGSQGIIYKIYNDVNNKIYIGQTCSTIKHRMSQHLYRAKSKQYENLPLYNAIRKYGAEHFFIKEIERVPQELLSEREIYWIKFYNSFIEGYNATTGGEGTHRTDSTEIMNLWNAGWYQKDIALKTGHKSQTIKSVLLSNGITEQELKNRTKELSNKYKYKPVLRIDSEGNTTEYPSLTECVSQNDISMATLSRGLKDGVPRKGYFWRYKNE